MTTQKVGILDSGVGGLSILLEIRKLLPDADLHYIGDSAWCPYGTKSSEEIRGRVSTIVDYLLANDASLIVVACNSATIQAVEWLREKYPNVEIVGTEPAVKPASQLTKTGIIGVLATEASIAGEKFRQLVLSKADGVEVIKQACPGFVSLVEKGNLEGPEVENAIREYTSDMIARGADVIVLGCTHYPFLRKAFQKIVPPEVTIIDSGAAIARRVDSLLPQKSGSGELHLETSGPLEVLQQLTPVLLGDAGRNAVFSVYSG